MDFRSLTSDSELRDELQAVIASVPSFEVHRFVPVFLRPPDAAARAEPQRPPPDIPPAAVASDSDYHGSSPSSLPRTVQPILGMRSILLTLSWVHGSTGRIANVLEHVDVVHLNSLYERIIDILHASHEVVSILSVGSSITASWVQTTDDRPGPLGWRVLEAAAECIDLMRTRSTLQGLPDDVAVVGFLSAGWIYSSLVGNYRFTPFLVGEAFAQRIDMLSALEYQPAELGRLLGFPESQASGASSSSSVTHGGPDLPSNSLGGGGGAAVGGSAAAGGFLLPSSASGSLHSSPNLPLPATASGSGKGAGGGGTGGSLKRTAGKGGSAISSPSSQAPHALNSKRNQAQNSSAQALPVPSHQQPAPTLNHHAQPLSPQQQQQQQQPQQPSEAADPNASSASPPEAPSVEVPEVVHGHALASEPEEEAFDFTAVPGRLDEMCLSLDSAGDLRPTIISVAQSWTLTGQETVLAQPQTKALGVAEQKAARDVAFDLIDSLSRSGTLAFDEGSLHVVVGCSHQFDKSITDTVVQDNVNPIQKVERSYLIVASAIHELPTGAMLKKDVVQRVTHDHPVLFLNQDQK